MHLKEQFQSDENDENGRKKNCECFRCKANSKKGKCNILESPTSTEQTNFNLIRSDLKLLINS